MGVTLLLDLRMLGLMKSVPFAALHRLLPWGVLGFFVNTLTGMLFFAASPGQYVMTAANAELFLLKMVFIVIAGLNALYFTVLDEAWLIRAGEDAPPRTKLIAASAIVLWLGVIYCGSMLPFIGGAFSGGEEQHMEIGMMVALMVAITVALVAVAGVLINRSARRHDRDRWKRASRGKGTVMNEFLHALENMSFSVWVRESGSIWGFGTVLVLHTIGMSLVAGLSAMIKPVCWCGFGGAGKAARKALSRHLVGLCAVNDTIPS